MKVSDLRCGCGGQVVNRLKTTTHEDGHDEYQYLKCLNCGMRTPSRSAIYNGKKNLEFLISIWDSAMPKGVM